MKVMFKNKMVQELKWKKYILTIIHTHTKSIKIIQKLSYT